MTHVPGHIGTDNTPALAALDGDLSSGGFSVAGYTNQVYLGKQKVPGFTTQSPTGATYNVKSRKSEKVMSVQEAKALYLTDPNIEKEWLQTLRKNGIDTSAPDIRIKARSLWDISVGGASDWYATSNGTQKVTPEQYLGWYVGGAKKGPALPTRQVYAATPEQIDADINTIATKTLGREIQDADKQADWYQDLVKGINKLYSKGTVTTVEQVKNPKTGKMEKVVKQTPGFSKEQITEKITGAVEAADPESLARKERIDFTKWMFGRGGQG